MVDCITPVMDKPCAAARREKNFLCRKLENVVQHCISRIINHLPVLKVVSLFLMTNI